MNSLSDVTLGQIGRGLARYRPMLLVALAVVLVAVFLPGPPQPGDTLGAGQSFSEGAGTTLPDGSAGAGTPAGTQGAPADPGVAGGEAPSATGAVGGSGTTGTTGGPGTTGTTGGAGSGHGSAPQGAAPAFGGNRSGGGQAKFGPNCDTKTGRVRIPLLYAPQCVPVFSGDNGGATYQGVTAKTITVAVYVPQSNAAVDASLSAAGVADTPEDREATIRGLAKLMEKRLETYGRTVKFEFFRGSGPAADDSAAKADAIKVATQIKAFASFGAPNESYVAELAARGVMCICTSIGPASDYAKYSPYRWGPDLMTGSQNYLNLAEYLGKRVAPFPVKFGAAEYRGKPRKFGLIYLDNKQGSGTKAANEFSSYLARFRVQLTDRYGYQGDLSKAQEQARTVIARFKQKGVTDVMCFCDPLTPAFFTKEATNQIYFPEWIVTGYFVTDAAVFARTYDQRQWQNAFGIAQLNTPYPVQKRDAWSLWRWGYGSNCPAKGQCQAVFDFVQLFYQGIHLAGPKLTPQNFKAAMFSFKPAGGGPTHPYMSYGPPGLYPFEDYSWIDDMAEIWWDDQATGPDEIGNNGVGLYRWVNKGARYTPGKWLTGETPAFNPQNTVLSYEESPPGDRNPDYPPPGR
jgi:hypothetical protein